MANAITKFKKYVADSTTGCQMIGYVAKERLEQVRECLKDIDGLDMEDYPSRASAKHFNDAKLA